MIPVGRRDSEDIVGRLDQGVVMEVNPRRMRAGRWQVGTMVVLERSPGAAWSTKGRGHREWVSEVEVEKAPR